MESLQHNNFEVRTAMEHAEEYVPKPEKPFSTDEQRLFCKGLATHGKDFRLIRNEVIDISFLFYHF